MTSDRRRAARRVFMEVVDLPADQQADALAAACDGDEALRTEVEALLQFEAQVGGDTADLTPDRAASPRSSIEREQVGQMIGRYKLLEQIGEGGFGSVWAAEQREPVKRRVALKIIKLGMDTKQVIARFEAERQALAMMDHPNIARVLDAGSTETGRPFFAMELVKGVPILEYCDSEKLDTDARLELFTKVCQAIQHAHQKGIIHRDIKPSNVLVTMHDGVPVPKVIDFGIAKATNQELTEKTVYTQHRQMIGTPAYMSPEQAEMSGLDIDTRSDIYSLGVLLYELLTGTTPFDTTELMSQGFAEMMRIIREQEPHKPSTRLSSLGVTATRTAMQRRADVKKLGLMLRGDLDWIVMKCLEKDRTRRYESASGLAADIHRHLNNEPVLAGPPSTSYKLHKFIKRNKGQVVAGAFVAATLALGVVGTTGGLVWALDEKERADTEAVNATLAADAAERARIEAQENEVRALAEADRAERELVRAVEIKRLITEMLESIDPGEVATADLAVMKEILASTGARLDAGEITDELINAELDYVVGSVYLKLTLLPEAERHLSRSLDVREQRLGESHDDTLLTMHRLGKVYELQDRAQQMEEIYARLLERARQLDDGVWTMRAENGLGMAYMWQGRFDDALELTRNVLAQQERHLGPDHQETLNTLGQMAMLYGRVGRPVEALEVREQQVERMRRVRGSDDLQTLIAITNLAREYTREEQYDKAEVLLRESQPKLLELLGPEHNTSLWATNVLGTFYLSTGRPEEAEPLLRAAMEGRRAVIGDGHFRTRYSIDQLADCLVAMDRTDEAIPLYQEILDYLEETASGPDATTTELNSAAWNLLTHDLEQLRDPEMALGFAERACALAETDDANLWMYLDTLALARHVNGQALGAVEAQRRSIALAPDGTDTSGYEQRLADYEAALQIASEEDR